MTTVIYALILAVTFAGLAAMWPALNAPVSKFILWGPIRLGHESAWYFVLRRIRTFRRLGHWFMAFPLLGVCTVAAGLVLLNGWWLPAAVIVAPALVWTLIRYRVNLLVRTRAWGWEWRRRWPRVAAVACGANRQSDSELSSGQLELECCIGRPHVVKRGLVFYSLKARAGRPLSAWEPVFDAIATHSAGHVKAVGWADPFLNGRRIEEAVKAWQRAGEDKATARPKEELKATVEALQKPAPTATRGTMFVMFDWYVDPASVLSEKPAQAGDRSGIKLKPIESEADIDLDEIIIGGNA